MSDLLSDAFWQNEFDIKTDDLNRIADKMREEKRAFTLVEMARRIVRRRLRYGRDTSPTALPDWVKEQKILSWDQLAEWKLGDQVLVAHRPKEKIQPYFGRIIREDPKTFYIRLQGEKEPIKYSRVAPGSLEAQKRYEHVKNAIWELEQAARQKEITLYDEENVEIIVLTFGSHIATRLLTALEHDERFYVYEDRWLLTELLEQLPASQLESLHKRLLAGREVISFDDLSQMIHLPSGDIGLFSIYHALSQFPEKFEQMETGWVARKPPPTPWDQALGAFYAYDPDTWEIILQPGQPLTKKTAERLEELGWYAEMVVPV